MHFQYTSLEMRNHDQAFPFDVSLFSQPAGIVTEFTVNARLSKPVI